MSSAILNIFLAGGGHFAYLVAFVVLLGCGLGIPIPEDLTLFAMGYLAYLGMVKFRIAVVVCFVGVMLGDSIVYYLGYRFGPRLLKKDFFARIFTDERMARTKSLLGKWGNKVIFAARFMPGVRAPTFFTAGVLKLPFRVFFFYDGLAALLSVPALVGATYFFGSEIDHAVALAKKIQFGIVGLILSVIAILVAKHFLTKQKRR